MLNSEYPLTYSASEETCLHAGTNFVKIKEFIRIKPDSFAMRDALRKQGPLSIAIGAGSLLSTYRSGIIEADDTRFCSGFLNHAVTLVGYFPGETTETERRNVPRCRLRR